MKVLIIAVAALAAAALVALGIRTTGGPLADDAPPPAAEPAEPTATAAPAPVGEEQLSFDRLDGSGGTLVSADAQLEDVRLTARDVSIHGSGLTMGEVTVDGVVPFDVVAAQIGPGVHVEAAGDGRARITRSAEVLGQQVPLSATGRVQAVGGNVVVEPTTVEVGGPQWLEELLGRTARSLVTISHPVEGLPEGLRLDDVDVGDTGFQVHLSGRDVTFSG